jgi:c-di-AMP phosphodiesterase-like protein
MKTKILCYIIDGIILISLIAVWVYVLITEMPMKSIIAIALISLILIILGGVVLFVAMRSESGEKSVKKQVEEKEEVPVIEKPEPVTKNNDDPETDIMLKEPTTEIIFDKGSDKTEIIPQKRSFYVKLQDKNNSVKTYQTYFDTEAIIGRHEGNCNIVLADEKSVSRRHCRLFVDNDKIMVEDLGSSNRTYVNGVQVEGRALEIKSGDELRMGRAIFIVTIN